MSTNIWVWQWLDFPWQAARQVQGWFRQVLKIAVSSWILRVERMDFSQFQLRGWSFSDSRGLFVHFCYNDFLEQCIWRISVYFAMFGAEDEPLRSTKTLPSDSGGLVECLRAYFATSLHTALFRSRKPAIISLLHTINVRCSKMWQCDMLVANFVQFPST